MDRRSPFPPRPATRTPDAACGSGPTLASTIDTVVLAVIGALLRDKEEINPPDAKVLKLNDESCRLLLVRSVAPAIIDLMRYPGGRFSIVTRYSAVGPDTRPDDALIGTSVRAPVARFTKRMN